VNASARLIGGGAEGEELKYGIGYKTVDNEYYINNYLLMFKYVDHIFSCVIM